MSQPINVQGKSEGAQKGMFDTIGLFHGLSLRVMVFLPFSVRPILSHQCVIDLIFKQQGV